MAHKISVSRWQLPRTARGSYFYPVTKFVGRVHDEAGNVIAQTGKCATHMGALNAANRLRDKLTSGKEA